MSKKQENNLIERPPVIVVMGHIDHGKSTLLDFIRHSNSVATEAGNITQRVSAYEVVHKNKLGEEKKITFIDTPGHSAFSAMRARGAGIADIAILIISAEDGVKPQTLEAYKNIQEADLPFAIAINKIDRPNANVEKVKQELMTNNIFLEGNGGEISFVAISAKTGEGVPELLDTVLLLAEMEELTGDLTQTARGFVLESKRETGAGRKATVIIKDGKLKQGDFVVVDNISSPIRRLENFLGEQIETANFSSPVKIFGWNALPEAGLPFLSFPSKKEAEQNLAETTTSPTSQKRTRKKDDGRAEILLIIKADVSGSLEAIKQELSLLEIDNEKVFINIISTGVGDISENDIKIAGRKQNVLIVGFNVKIERQIQDLAERHGIKLKSFAVIYELAKWLEENIKTLIPKTKEEEEIGQAKIIKVFSQAKETQIVGGKVKAGQMPLSAEIKILRRDCEIGRGVIANIQSQKAQVKEVREGEEFGMSVKSKINIAAGDVLVAFEIVEK